MADGPKPTDVRVMVPRRCEAAWHRISATIMPQLEAVGIARSPGNVLAAMIEMLDGTMHPGRGMPCLDPRVPVYEAPPRAPEPPHTAEQRAEFWARMALNPPKPGRAPILPPGDEYQREAEEKYPKVYVAEDDEG